MILYKVLLFLYLSITVKSVSVKRCHADLQSHVSNINLIPSRFKQGDNIILSFDLLNSGPIINNGFISYEIFNQNNHYYPQIDRICDIVPCPIYNKTITMKIPIKIPEYNDDIIMIVELLDFNQLSFACIKIQLNTGIWRNIKNLFIPSENPVHLTKKLRGPSNAPIPKGNRTIESAYNYTFIASLNSDYNITKTI